MSFHNTMFLEVLIVLLNVVAPLYCAPTDNNIVDLSYDYSEDTPQWPGSGTKFEVNNKIEGFNDKGLWMSARSFCTAEHAGTHLDSPNHFVQGKWSVEQIPIDRLVAHAVVVDIADKLVKLNTSDVQLTIDDLTAWEGQHGRIPNGSIVIMYSGWGQHYRNHAMYFGNGMEVTTDFHFPGFHPDAAQWLISNRSIVGIGVDTASLDYGPSLDFQTHRVIGAANVYGLENLANLDKLPPKGALLYVMPMKIQGGTGAPCRILAHLNSPMQTTNSGHQNIKPNV